MALDGLVHGWDLATATAQPWAPSDELVAEVDAFARGAISAEMRDGGAFGPELTADGGTPMVEVLEYAAKKILPDANVDTIYFLSDGQPSDGTPEMVLDSTRKIFERHRIRFNTISIGEDAPTVFGEESLLQQMAAHTGGAFTQPK